IKYNDETKEIFVVNWLKHNKINSPKVKSCIVKELKDTKHIAYVAEFISQCNELGYRIDTSTIPYLNGIQSLSKDHGEEEEKEESPVAENLAIDFYMRNFGVISSYMGEEINQWVDDLTQELVVKAMQITLENNKRSWSYTKGILKDWHSNNFKTVADVEAAQEEFRRQQKNKKRTGTGYATRKEVVPEWLHQQEEPDPIPQQNQTTNTDEERRRLDEVLQKYKKNKGE
ncbi:DnaD domain protein, partial [Bacillus sp. JJ1127]|uniref:DnaD domain-containing protein n=1 Tax=Bacillus sp. JJ1127 TaxID=3122952 RepID=UPI003000E7D5